MYKLSTRRFILVVVLKSLLIFSLLAPDGSIWQLAGVICGLATIPVGVTRSELNQEVRFTLSFRGLTFKGCLLQLIVMVGVTFGLYLLVFKFHDDYPRRLGVAVTLWLAMVIDAFWRRRSLAKAAPPAPEPQC